MSKSLGCNRTGIVLDAAQTLKSVHKEAYDCALCACGYEPTLDEMVEVAFTVSPRVRRIAAHDPHSLPIWEYFRQICLPIRAIVFSPIARECERLCESSCSRMAF